MAIKYNKEQLNIINQQLDHNILVSAAAGSGKTSVLTERIVRLVSDEIEDVKGLSLSNILVMTFTRKATREMAFRIRQALVKKEKMATGEQKKKLMKEVATIQNANIFTIDAFCKKVLDENYTKIAENNSLYYPFDINFRVGSENEIDVLRDDVLSVLLEEKYMDPDYRHLFDSYIVKTNEEDLKKLLKDGIKKISSLPWPLDFLEDYITNFKIYEDKSFKDFVNTQIGTLKKIKNDVLSSKIYLNEMTSLCNAVISSGKTAKGNKLSDKALDALDNIIKYLEKYLIYIDKFADSNIISEDNKGDAQIDNLILRSLADDFNELSSGFPRGPQSTIFDESIKERYNFYKEKIIELTNELLDIKIISDDINVSDEIKYNINQLEYYKFLKEYYLRIIEEKKKKNTYEVSDFSSIALDILYDRVISEDKKVSHIISQTAEELSASYKSIFIDEYQDTNFVQEMILSAISNNFQNNNVFMVGDVKQSIYKFRNAEPSIFVEKYKEFKDEKVGKNMLLSINYRSGKEIISYVNDLFSKTMIASYGDIDYSDGNELVERDSEKERDFDNSKKVEIKVICPTENKNNNTNKNEDTNENENTNNSENTANESADSGTTHNDDDVTAKNVKGVDCEAEYVAQEIFKLVNEGKCHYKDIVILMRATTNRTKPYIEALNKYKIPTYVDERTGFFYKLEIKLVIDILKIIDNPTQNIYLASVLLSDVFNMTNDELAFIKLVAINATQVVTKDIEKDNISSISYDIVKNSDFNLYDAISYIHKLLNDDTSLTKEEFESFDNMFDGIGINRNQLKHKINNFFDKFIDIQFKARFLSISEIINEIYDKFNIKDIVRVFPDSSKRVANLDALYDLALNFETSSGVGLFNFNRYVEKIREINKDQGEAKIFDENADVVRIMTIHTAKGLEFDTVFLCSCNSRYNIKDAGYNTLFQFDKDYGFALDYYNLKDRYNSITPKKKFLTNKLVDAIKQEELRMLYVALTRAINKLYIVGNVQKHALQGISMGDLDYIKELVNDDNAINTKKEIKDFNSFFEVVLYNYNKSLLPFCEVEFVDMAIEEDMTIPNKFELKCIEDDIDEMNKIEMLNDEYFAKVDTENLDENLNYQYPYSEYETIPPKYSVTALKSLSADKNVYNENNISEKTNIIDVDEDIDDVRLDKDKSDSHNIGGANLGTIYHKFMQHLDYSKVNECLNDERYSKIIDKTKILKFLETKLGKEFADAFDGKKLYREQKFMQLFSKNEIDAIAGSHCKSGDQSGDMNETESRKDELCEPENRKGELCAPENRRGELCEPDVFNDKCIIIQGIIDAFYLKKDENGNDYIVLMDYKTDSINKKIIDEDIFANELIERYKIQLDVYAKVLENLTGYKVKEKYIYSFALDKEIAI